MDKPSNVLIASLMNVITDLNHPTLPKNYRKIRPDITGANVISMASKGFAGPTIVVGGGSGLPGETKASVDQGQPMVDDITAPASDMDMNKYFGEGSNDPMALPVGQSPFTGSNPLSQTEQRQEGQLIGSLDDPHMLTPRGMMEIWRELKTLHL